MAGESKTTTDHDVIRRWIEQRGGMPAKVRGTGNNNDPGLLRIIFKKSDDRLEAISWEDFFTKFDDNNLAFLYQDEKSSGEESRFFKFIRQ